MGSIPQLSILRGPQRDLNPCLLHRIIEDNIPRLRNHTALIYENGKNNNPVTVTYKELNETSNKTARCIIRDSVTNFAQPNSDKDYIIAVSLQPSEKLITVLLSIWKSGAAYLPLDPSFPTSRVHHIINEAKPIIVICEDNQNTDIYGETTVIKISELLSRSSSLENSNLSSDEILSNCNNDIGLILYTSGSTGIPKGVRLPHSIVLNRLQWQWETFPYSNTETFCVFKTALTFVDSVTEIWGPLLTGRSILIIPKEITKDPERLVLILEKYTIRRLVLVPTLLRSILMYLLMQKQKRLLWNLNTWVCSGETLSTSLVRNFYDYFEEGVHFIHNFYGSTEIMGDVTFFTCEGKRQLEKLEKIPIGVPINNTVIYLLDSDFRPVKLGEIGEIFVAGLNLARGYTNGRDPDKFLENPLAIDSKYSRLYRTGDYGSIQNGVVIYEGRTDSQIKIRGHRVDLSEVEKNILMFDFVERTIALCYHPGEVDQNLLAFITLKNDTNLSGLQIETYLKQKLPEYMIPQVVIIESIPLLVNGKIDRQTLLKSYENTNNNDDSSVPVEFDFTDVPKELKHIALDLFETIGSVLGRSIRKALSPSSNFYELGGHSLNSIVTVTLLREKGYHISISDFIGAKNLGEILFKMNKPPISSSMEEEFVSYFDVLIEAKPLRLEDKQSVVDVIASSFYEKADLEQWIKPNISITDYEVLLEEIWETLVEKDLSFIVRDANGEVLGVALNFDAKDEPEVQIDSKLFYIFDFLEHIEGPIRDTALPKGLNKILHAFMMGTNERLNAQQNIAVMTFMENEVLKVAKDKNFVGIFTTNTNPLTQQLGSEVYKYKVMLDYQVNKYLHPDGSRPFAMAPDSQRAIVHWKEV